MQGAGVHIRAHSTNCRQTCIWSSPQHRKPAAITQVANPPNKAVIYQTHRGRFRQHVCSQPQQQVLAARAAPVAPHLLRGGRTASAEQVVGRQGTRAVHGTSAVHVGPGAKPQAHKCRTRNPSATSNPHHPPHPKQANQTPTQSRRTCRMPGGPPSRPSRTVLQVTEGGT